MARLVRQEGCFRTLPTMSTHSEGPENDVAEVLVDKASRDCGATNLMANISLMANIKILMTVC